MSTNARRKNSSYGKITAANQKIDIRFLANGIYIVSLRYKSEKLEYYGKLSKN